MFNENQIVKVRWNNFTRKWYLGRGYEFTKNGDYFDCNLKDVMPTSTVKIDITCDYCGIKTKKEYRNVMVERELINKDCCRSCGNIKQREIMLFKYNVDNAMKLKKNKEKARKKYQLDFNVVKEKFNNLGYDVISEKDEYQNNRSKIKFICSKHKDNGIQTTSIGSINRGGGCKVCRKEKIAKARRLDFGNVKNEFEKRNYILLDKVYKNNSTPLKYRCKTHPDIIQKIAYGNLAMGQGCNLCAMESRNEKLRTDSTVVFKLFYDKNIKPLQGEVYKNEITDIKFTCNTHPSHIQKTTYKGLQHTKVPCKYCREENNISKLNKRLRSSITTNWKRDSEKESNYQCVLTGDKNYDVHHTYSYNAIIKDALSDLKIKIKNKYTAKELVDIKERVVYLHKRYIGVCLRRDLHILFHQIYSKENNTLEQFEEFKNDYINGKYNSIAIVQ